MHDAAEFDRLYGEARARLLLQTFALTGDLPAARGAVRDAFVAAWHHWRKVSRIEDVESWVRPHAWSLAQRRHTGRIWHRDKALGEESRATLDALSELSMNQRKALLLDQLSTASPGQMARELGLTDETAARELQVATEQFALHRGVPVTGIRSRLEALSERTAGTRFPRPTIIRRGGDARRRVHTTFGVAVCVGALLGTGAVVHHTDGAMPLLGGVSVAGTKTTSDDPEASTTTHLDVDALLTSADVTRAVGPLTVGSPSTSDNTTGDGLNTACQRTRFADPAGLATLVRTFPVRGTPENRVLQSVELSVDEAAARETYAITKAWYTSCQDERAQLISAHELEDVGDEGIMVMLNTWDRPVQTWLVSIVRTGNLVTSVVRSVESTSRPEIDPWVQLTVEAVTALCGHEEAGACPGPEAGARRVPPPPTSDSPGLLQVIDLPPVAGVEHPWVATDPEEATTNLAATRCDRASFTGDSVQRSMTRTFVIPQAELSSSFGLTETLGEFSSPAQALAYLETVEGRMDNCEDNNASAEVTEVDRGSTSSREHRIWQVTIEVSEDRFVNFEMALVQLGSFVVQVGFVPDGDHVITEAAFRELTLRAAARLSNLQD